MIYKNREGLIDYNISETWYKNRRNGISAIIRVGNEEQWIGPCLESILPFFDEIVITIDSSDKTKDIIKSFKSKKIKLYDYPFKLGPVKDKSYTDSVHDRAYYSNWTLSKTTYNVVSKWDADMIMLPSAYDKKLYDLAKKKNILRINGYNLVSLDPPHLSKIKPYEHYEPRFFKIDKELYFVQAMKRDRPNDFDIKKVANIEYFTYDRAGLLKLFNPITWINITPTLGFKRVYNMLTRNDISIDEPIFIHTKFTKKNVDQFWYSKQEQKFKEVGEKLNIELPSYMYKTPKDYLNS